MIKKVISTVIMLFYLFVQQEVLAQCSTAGAVLVPTSPTTCTGNDGLISFIGLGLSPSTTYSLTYKKNGVLQPVTNITTNASGTGFVFSGLDNGIYSFFILSAGVCTDTIRQAVAVEKVCLTINPIVNTDSILTGNINIPYTRIRVYVDNALAGGGFTDASGNFSIPFDTLTCNSGSHLFKVIAERPYVAASIDTAGSGLGGYINGLEGYYATYDPVKGYNVIGEPFLQALDFYPWSPPKAGVLHPYHNSPYTIYGATSDKIIRTVDFLGCRCITRRDTLNSLPANIGSATASLNDSIHYIGTVSNGDIYVFDYDWNPVSPFVINTGAPIGFYDMKVINKNWLIAKGPNDSLYIIDLATNMHIAGSPFYLGAGSSGPWGVVSPDQSKYFFSGSGVGAQVKVFDLNTLTVVHTSSPLQMTPWLVFDEGQFTADGSQLMFGSLTGTHAYKMSTDPPYTLDSILISNNPVTITVSVMNDTFFMANQYDINLYSLQKTDSITAVTDTTWDYYFGGGFALAEDTSFSIVGPVCFALPVDNAHLEGNINSIGQHQLRLETYGEESVAYISLETRHEKEPDYQEIYRFEARNEPEKQQLYDYQYTNLPLTGNYFYRARIVDIDGNYSFSNTIYLRKTDQGEIMVYPNPAEDKIHIYLSKDFRNAECFVELMDMSGRVLLEEKNIRPDASGNIELNISSLPNGLYALFIHINNNQTQFKVHKK